MAYKTGNTTNSSGQLETSQNKTDIGSSPQWWRVQKDNNLIAFRKQDDNKLQKWVNGVLSIDDVVVHIDTASDYIPSNEYITMFVDREVNKLYVLFATIVEGSSITRYMNLNIYSIADMSLIDTTEHFITLGISGFKPLQMQITPDTTKIVLLCNNGYLYGMDLDGSNVFSYNLGIYATSFCINNNSKIYYDTRFSISTRFFGVLTIVDSSFTLDNSITYSFSVADSDPVINCFIYNDIFYSLVEKSFSSGAFIIKTPISATIESEINIIDIELSYCMHFFHYKEKIGTIYTDYGALYVNDGGSNKYVSRFDFDDNSLTPLRLISKTDETTSIEAVSIFSNDTTYPIATREMSQSGNDDITGLNWALVNNIES